MDLQKINIKIFCEPPNLVSLTDFIDVFHGWIQASDGDYHDVADYSHMQAGPGIVLVANEANVSIDETAGRRGLLFSQKKRLEGSNREKLGSVLRAALANCRKLEQEPALRGKLRFVADEILISVNDRGVRVNSTDAYEELKGNVASIAQEFFGDGEVRFEHNNDPRQRLNVLVKSSAPVRLH